MDQKNQQAARQDAAQVNATAAAAGALGPSLQGFPHIGLTLGQLLQVVTLLLGFFRQPTITTKDMLDLLGQLAVVFGVEVPTVQPAKE